MLKQKLAPKLRQFCFTLENLQKLKPGDGIYLSIMLPDILFTKGDSATNIPDKEVITKYTAKRRAYFHKEGVRGLLDAYEEIEFTLLVGNEWIRPKSNRSGDLNRYAPETILGCEEYPVVPSFYIDDFLAEFELSR